MGKIHIEVSAKNDNVRGYLRAFSFYDAEKGKRVIAKEQITCREIEDNIEGIKKSSIATRLNKCKEEGLLVQQGDVYIVQEPQGSYVSLDEEFYKKMLATFNSDTNNIYVWLLRRFNYLKSKGRNCYFTKGQICVDALGKADHSKNRQKVETALTQLCLNGLISYRIVKYKGTFLRELLYIGTKMIVVDTIETAIEEMTGGLELASGSIDADYDNIEENVEVIAQLGYSEEKLLQLNSRLLLGENYGF